MPTRNYSSAHFEDAEKVSGEALNENYVAKIMPAIVVPCDASMKLSFGKDRIRHYGTHGI